MKRDTLTSDVASTRVDFRINRPLVDPADAEQAWWDVIAPAFDVLSTADEPNPRLHELTPGQRALYALHWMRSEVDNGGFHQYLYNHAGNLAAEALRGAERIRASEFADLLRSVRAIFADEFIDDCDSRREVLSRLSPASVGRLDELTKQFYELMGYESGWEQSRLARHCAAYVQAHPEEFFHPPATA